MVYGVGVYLCSGRRACTLQVLHCISTQGKPRVTAINTCGPARMFTSPSAQGVCLTEHYVHALKCLRLGSYLDNVTGWYMHHHVSHSLAHRTAARCQLQGVCAAVTLSHRLSAQSTAELQGGL